MICFEGITGYNCVLDKHSGSVVECLALDLGVVGLNLIGGTGLYPRVRHFTLCLVLVQPRKTCLDMTEKNVDWDVKNQIKNI